MAKVPLPLKVDAELKERLEQLARADYRALNNYCEMVLLRHCDRVEALSAGVREDIAHWCRETREKYAGANNTGRTVLTELAEIGSNSKPVTLSEDAGWALRHALDHHGAELNAEARSALERIAAAATKKLSSEAP